MVGKITKQQLKVFGMFAVAFLLSGMASVYAQRGVTYLAIAAAAVALGLVGEMVQETYRDPGKSR